METSYLKELDLTENESKVFLALLKLKKAHAGQIANEIGLHRKTIYDCLRRLEEKGLVGTFMEKRVKHYKAVNPQRLLEIMNDKKVELEKKEEKIIKILPELLNLYNTSKEEINAVIYKGKKGLISIMEDVLKSRKKELLSLISTAIAPRLFPKYLPIWHKKRERNKIIYKVIYYSHTVAEKRAKEHVAMKYAYVRCISQVAYMPISIWIYDDKVAFMIWEAKLGILIESKKVADSFRKHFEVLWKIAIKLNN